MERLSRKSFAVLILSLLILILPTIMAVDNEHNNTNISDSGQTIDPKHEIMSSNLKSDKLKEENTDPVTMNSENPLNKYQNIEKLSLGNKQELKELETPWPRTQELRNLYSDRIKFTTKGDGATTAEFYITPTFYQDAQGTQQFIDTTIERTEIENYCSESNQDTIYEYQNVKNNLKLHFNRVYSPDIESNLISIKDRSDQNQLTWQPLRLSTASEHDSALEEFWNQGKFDINLLPTQGLAIENMMVYENIYPGCEDRYIVKPNELRHDFILNEFPDELLNLAENQLSAKDDPDASASFLNYYGILSLPVSIAPYVDGAIQTKAFETSKAIELQSIVTGEPIYSIKGPIAYEQSNPEQRIKCNYEFIPLFDTHSGPTNPWTKTLVVLKTDLNWLKSPSRQYPVILDPDLETPKYDKGEEGFDTYLVQGNETEPEWTDRNFGESTKLKVTLAGPSLYSNLHLLHRSILKFPGINIIKSNAQVTSANLILVCNNHGNMSITVFKLYDNWIEGNGTETKPGKIGATWNNSGFNIWSGGNYDGHVTDHATVKVEDPSYYTWNIIDIVRDWITDPIDSPNNGLLLTGTDNEDVIKEFHSSDASNPNVRPKIVIEFNTPPQHTGLENVTVYETQPNIVPATVNRKDIFRDPDVDDLEDPGDDVEFELWNGTVDKNYKLNYVSTGIYNSPKNFSVELKVDQILYITPYEKNETYGTDTIKLRVKDLSSGWKYLDFTISVIETNDKPVIKRIDDNPDFDKWIYNVTEDEPRILPIEVYDPDNPDFFEKSKPKAGDPGDLDFNWERYKTNRFVISETGNIIINPDNSLVGNFYMNITVYDTEWYKKGKRILKRQLSNYTTMLTFVIENSNDPPDTPHISEPKENSEFSTEDIITFSGKCTDDDLLVPDASEKLTFKWILGEDTPLGQGPQIKTRISKGRHLITLRVEDLAGEFSEVNTTINVRNRANIDKLNCSNYFVDEIDDVLCFYYEITDDGHQTFRAERGSFAKYNVFNTDIKELTSKRVGQYLWVNLTISENITYILESQNLEYEFAIYLVKPKHQEELIDLKGIQYLGSRYDDLYQPSDHYARFILDNKYYNSNGLGEFKITNKGRTLALRAHLGDLEAGEGDYSKLREDFSIFSTVKIEVEQHPLGSFQHIICFDSTGYGGKTAPYPQQLKHDSGNDNTNQFGSSLAVGIIILIIIISIIGFLLLRREAKKITPDEKIVIDTTKPSVGGLGMPMQMQMPSGMGMRGVPGRFPSTGTRPMFIPPSMMRPGGRPMMPMSRPPIPPTSGKGKGRISPITTSKKSTAGTKKK